MTVSFSYGAGPPFQHDLALLFRAQCNPPNQPPSSVDQLSQGGRNNCASQDRGEQPRDVEIYSNGRLVLTLLRLI